MPTLEAVTEFYYDKKVRKVGEQFEASDEDARLLLGWSKVKKARGEYRTAQVKSEPYNTNSSPPNYVDTESDIPKKRKYQRRDMRAQE